MPTREGMWIAFSVQFVLCFTLIRTLIYVHIRDHMNRSRWKKTVKGQRFFDWFLYRRFRDFVSKPKLLLYYYNMLLFVLGIAVTIVFYAVEALAPYVRPFFFIFSAPIWIPLILYSLRNKLWR